MKHLFLFLFSLIFFAAALPVQSFLISPAQVELAFAPGTTQIINMTVSNNEQTDKSLAVSVLYNWLPPSVQQELQGRITADIPSIQFHAADTQRVFRVTMNLPETLSAGGTLEIRVAVTEEATTGIVGSRASNVMRILLFVPGQYVRLRANVTGQSNTSTNQTNQPNQTVQSNQSTIGMYNATINRSYANQTIPLPAVNHTVNRTGSRKTNQTVQTPHTPSPRDTSPPSPTGAEFILPGEQQPEQLPFGEEMPAPVMASPVKTPTLPLLAAVIAGVSLLLIGTALLFPLLLRKPKPIGVQYFYAANTMQGSDMPIAVLIENPNFTSTENVHLNIAVRDAENNFVKQLRHGPVTVTGNYRGTLNLACRTDDMQPGNYLLELTVHARNQSIKRFSHAQVYL